ncbi:MAG: DUF4062 domain-containing protein [Sulfuricurvum sp.]|uniref:DUF4062 domain-containing protein n=1 Tax=Sulfuricurvum sp. TaxID=2025608 RepID=UPI0025EE1C58|nr:DUF4062 domain-containing protein [Sulfuricurvum sp.]MBV5322033.1 DUF4062 domain-containing protein [Sulfuricurvum sp.]
MAIPRVFISSTCYDLKHIRESLKYFVKTVGYDPVLSDDGDVFYNPSAHTHDSCIKEVETCQLFILIIGGRYGGTFVGKETSITNNEYKEAIKNNIPVFALIENAVYSDHHVFATNKKNNPTIADQIEYPSVDNVKIFDFIDEVRKNVKNNAIFPFGNFSDIEGYLKKQWAGMMYDFLLQRNSEDASKITNRLLDDLSLATKKSQELIKVLLKATNSDEAEKAIEQIDYKVEAENFVRLIQDTFSIPFLRYTTIDELKAIDLNQNTWWSFLEKTNDFFTEEWDEEEGFGVVLWIRDQGVGLGIKSYTNGKPTTIAHPKIEQAYNALKEVDESVRFEIYNKLVNNNSLFD